VNCTELARLSMLNTCLETDIAMTSHHGAMSKSRPERQTLSYEKADSNLAAVGMDARYSWGGAPF
jgi:hypothetical protein